MEKEYNGIVVIDKPKGYTSRDVVNRLSKILSTKKVGHTGTLDPLATGVLVCTVGRCTKLGEWLTSTYKSYSVEMVLGFETDTLDITGNKLYIEKKEFSKKEIEDAIKSFKGTYLQEVPKYSAVKINGKKLYEYARENIEIELPKREVTIKNIDNIQINGEIISFDCLVSKGTYIRSLVRDIGKKLGTYGTMINLRRTTQGKFKIEDSYKLEDIENNRFKIIPKEEILKDVYTIECNDSLYKEISNGVVQYLDLPLEYIVYKYKDSIIAMYKKDLNKFRMYIMF